MRAFLCSILLVTGPWASLDTVAADPSVFSYTGDTLPSEPGSNYAAWFTTLGPGHPTGSYFIGTSWASDGHVLTMQTEHPNDVPGVSGSKGIWFGRTDGYGDPSSGLNFAPTSEGNRIDLRAALGVNSSEWSLYWFDGSGYEAAFYFLDNGFHYYTTTENVFVPVADMTAFHTYGSHVYNGQVSYYFDGALLGSGNAYSGPANFMILGDGSAGDVSGYGTFRIDDLAITVNAGAAPVPEPGAAALLGLGLLGAVYVRHRQHAAR